MSSFSNKEEFVTVIQKGLEKKKLKQRYCHQNKFDLILCGGQSLISRRLALSDVYRLNFTGSKSVDTLPKMNVARKYSEAFYIKGEVYVFGGYDKDDNQIDSVEKYSPVTNNWKVIAQKYDGLKVFCSCSFIYSVYFLGGLAIPNNNHCMKFNTTNRKWSKISRTIETRHEASSAVFEGRIVVCGGLFSNTVEAYDHIADAWTYMPSMVHSRSDHNCVAIENKLFVFGGNTAKSLEVFDSTCNKFALIKKSYNSVDSSLFSKFNMISIGSKLAVFESFSLPMFWLYDTEKHEWSKHTYNRVKNIYCRSWAKVPRL